VSASLSDFRKDGRAREYGGLVMMISCRPTGVAALPDLAVAFPWLRRESVVNRPVAPARLEKRQRLAVPAVQVEPGQAIGRGHREGKGRVEDRRLEVWQPPASGVRGVGGDGERERDELMTLLSAGFARPRCVKDDLPEE
jgi:hypothetical protein